MGGAAFSPSAKGPAGEQAPAPSTSRTSSPASRASTTLQPLFPGLSSHFEDFHSEKQILQPTDFAIGFLPAAVQQEKKTAHSRTIPRPPPPPTTTAKTAVTPSRTATIAVFLALLLTAVSVHCCDLSRRFIASPQYQLGEVPSTPASMASPPDQHANWEDFLDHRPTNEATIHPRLINTLPAEYIPGYRRNNTRDFTSNEVNASSGKQKHRSKRPRIIVIGDVHGELEVLQNLLRKVGYTPRAEGGEDHVILAGDIINKGPDTPGVLDLAIKEGFSGVRGNHDDKLLKLFREYESVADGELAIVEDVQEEEDGEAAIDDERTASEEENAEYDEEESDVADAVHNLELRETQPDSAKIDGKKHKKDKKHKKKKGGKKNKHHISKKDRQGLAIIRSCTPEQRQWLANLPLILRVGHIPYWPSTSSSSTAESTTLGKPSLKKPSPYGGEVVVVHGGLVPGVPLEKQDPWAVLHMRTLLINEEKKGKGKHGKKGKKEKKHKKDKKHKKVKDTAELSSSSFDASSDDEIIASAGNRVIPPPFNDMTPLETREGTPWARMWDKYQQKHVPHQDERTTVIFGHDAKAGLQLGEYTFGLDTGCVAGGKLTAMVFSEDEKHQDEDEGVIKVTHQIFSVKCRDGTPNLL